jgi:hypothetical protein
MKLKTAIFTIAAALIGVGPPALAGPSSLRDVLEFQDERRAPPPPVARYMSGDGEEFVLDRSGRTALLKFDQSQEIWVLYPSAAPRGDVIYRNDIGAPVLRATKLGGLTLFTPARPSGAPAALSGGAEFLKLGGPMGAAALLQRLAQASVRASRAAQRLIPFEANGVTPGAETVYADAATVTAEGIARLTRAQDGRLALSHFRKVTLSPGRKPDVSFSGGIIQIILTPNLGMAGRPSSERVAHALQSAR